MMLIQSSIETVLVVVYGIGATFAFASPYSAFSPPPASTLHHYTCTLYLYRYTA